VAVVSTAAAGAASQVSVWLIMLLCILWLVPFPLCDAIRYCFLSVWINHLHFIMSRIHPKINLRRLIINNGDVEVD
jgi:hypothetical protein